MPSASDRGEVGEGDTRLAQAGAQSLVRVLLGDTERVDRQQCAERGEAETSGARPAVLPQEEAQAGASSRSR